MSDRETMLVVGKREMKREREKERKGNREGDDRRGDDHWQ